MAMPKSVVKLKKNGVEYVSNADLVNYTMLELTKRALTDVGRFVRREFKNRYYNKFNKISGDAGKITKSKVFASEKTLYPRVEIGLPHSHRGKKIDGFYAYFQEFGSKNVPQCGFLQSSVNENIATIREIESQYLSYLNDEAKALRKIKEAMPDEDADI